MSEVRVWRSRAAEILNDPSSAVLFAQDASKCGGALSGSMADVVAVYEAMEGSGTAQCFAARAGDELMGLAVVVRERLPPHGVRAAVVDRLAVKHEAGRSRTFELLMAAAEEYARECGCAAIYYSVPAGSPQAQMMFLSSDRYTNTNHVFVGRLG